MPSFFHVLDFIAVRDRNIDRSTHPNLSDKTNHRQVKASGTLLRWIQPQIHRDRAFELANRLFRVGAQSNIPRPYILADRLADLMWRRDRRTSDNVVVPQSYLQFGNGSASE